MAICCPDRPFVLLEPRSRRVGFLELAVERLALENVTVLLVRAEEAGIRGEACLARAFGPPLATWLAADRLVQARGELVYWAGRSWARRPLGGLDSLGVRRRICAEPLFSWQGPLVIMKRT